MTPDRDLNIQGLPFTSAAASHVASSLLPVVFWHAGKISPGTRVLDVGCGNGYFCGELLKRGCTVVGIDVSKTGIDLARVNYPKARFELLPATENVLGVLGEQPFDLVISTEVIEHVYLPRAYVGGCYAALKPGGRFICTTPYHGYIKNLGISLLGRWDHHADPLWDGGHIKLWSRSTLTRLLSEAGFRNIQFKGAGRLPYLWMSMVVSGDKAGGI